ncbi:hypothetical protein [Bradyrhizobium sp. USDA 4461]
MEEQDVVPASGARRLKKRDRDLECLLGRNTMEREVLKEVLDLTWTEKPTLLSRSQTPENTPSEKDPEILDVARSHLCGPDRAHWGMPCSYNAHTWRIHHQTLLIVQLE